MFFYTIILISRTQGKGAVTPQETELPDIQAGFRNGEEPEIKLPTSIGSQKKQKNSRKTSTSVSLTMLKPFTVWISRNWGTFIKRWELSRTCYQSLSNMYRGQKATETSLEKLTGSKFVNEYNNAVYCHLAYLIYMQSAC